MIRARAALGRRLAEARKAAGYTQESLAPLTHYVRSTIANVERGRQSIGRDFWIRCDEILRTDGELTRGYDVIRMLSLKSPVTAPPPSRAADICLPTRRQPPPSETSLSLLDPASAGECFGSQTLANGLWAPAGRFFPGLAIPAHVHNATSDGDQVLATVPAGYHDAPLLRGPHRGLVIGRTEADQGVRLFGLDARHARRRLAHAGPGARLPIPHAYQLDELVLALLWAMSNLDEALLADDALIERATSELGVYERMSRSAVSRDLAADMTDVGMMWLGSAFCARHIRRHADAFIDSPVYWTREQRGEEASTWLLFTHKQKYLQATEVDPGHPGPVRVFCIPRTAVDDSPRGERILLLLAVALIESHGIEVVITDEPEYAGTQGFVTDRDRHAVIATWVGAQGIWYVDVTDDRRTIRGYDDDAQHAAGRSIIAAAASPQRLRALADHLELDWKTLAQRCRDLADRGCAAVVQPRSRHLSTDGVDRACRYLATAAVATD
ncbi:helix-turn-helix domain-containing protein [Micromonospora echinofusca]|uniref:Helix-turn-helix domain-containing protein n=1 Tax=Micromonospora echinofusca TaxID=47858 RepID=A0ABS3VY24_MICEH|nr:helix-turn-helix domain-containing protein [Micromonospora echinofusca]